MAIYTNKTEFLKVIKLPITLMLSACLISFPSFSEQGVWQPIGPRAATVISMERSPVSPNIVYAGTYFGGLYRSVDGGITWQHIESDLSNKAVFSLKANLTSPDTLYAGTFEQGVFKSNDGGDNWSSINSGLLDLSVLDILPIQDTQSLLSATETGVFKSNDDGSTWALTNADQSPLYSKVFLQDPADASVIYLGTGGFGIYFSENSGGDWTQYSNGLTSSIVNGLSQNGSGELLAATDQGVFKIEPADLINNTGSWTDISFNLSDVPVFDLFTTDSDQTIAATQNGVYQFNGQNEWVIWDTFPARLLFGTPSGEIIHIAGALDIMEITGDMGASFFSADKGIQNRFVGALHTVKVFDWTVILAGTDKGVELTSEFFSFEGELPWLLTREFSGAVFDIVSHPIMADVLYVGAERTGVWKSTGFGSEWASKSDGMVPTIINDIAQTTGEIPILYSATSSGVYISNNSGQSWNTYSDTATPRNATSIAINSASSLIAYYGTEAGEIYTTFDGGDSFFLSWSGNGKPIKDIAIAPFYNIYTITADGQVLSSSDAGSNFFPLEGTLDLNATEIVIDPVKPWVAYLATAGDGVYKTSTRGIEWESINIGVDNPFIFSIDIASDNALLLFAGTVDGIYKSIDGGDSWEFKNNGLPEGFVNRIKVSPIDNNIIFATIDETSVYKSDDGGDSWALQYTSNNNDVALPILPDQLNANSAFLGDYQVGLKKSIDSGVTWTPINDGLTLFVRSLATTPLEPEALYAGSLSAGVFKSIDAAESWQAIGLQERNIFKIMVDPVDSEVIYAGTSLGISRTVNGGAEWQDLGQKLDFVFQVMVDINDPATIFLTSLAGQISKSTDAGQSWTLLDTELPLANILAIAQDPAAGTIYIALERKGIYKSADGGESWTATNNSLVGEQVTTISIGTNSQIYVGTQKKGLFASSNQGEDWTQLNITGHDEEIYISSIHQRESVEGSVNKIVVTILNENINDYKILSSSDDGLTWESISNGIVEMGVSSLSYSSDDSTIYATSINPTTVYKSSDAGNSWSSVASLEFSSPVSKLLTDPNNLQRIYAYTNSDNLLTSNDGGQTWSISSFSQTSNINQMIKTNDGRLLAATLGQGLLISDDDASSWSKGANTGIIYSSILGMAIDHQNTNTMYLATGGTGVHKSVDAGVSWEPINNGLSDLKILALEMSPIDSSVLYAATSESGVFITDDAGATWSQMNSGLFNKTITSLSVDPNDSNIIYAGTEGGGVFRINR